MVNETVLKNSFLYMYSSEPIGDFLKDCEIETNKSQPSELFSKILLGMKKASRKLVEESTANGRSLIVCLDGEIKKVPAKDLLAKVSE